MKTNKLFWGFILLCWLGAVYSLLFYPARVGPSLSRFTFYDKDAHILMFGILTYLLLAFIFNFRKLRFFWVAFLALVISAFLNFFGEYVQSFIPGRTPDVFDFLAGVAGSLFALPIFYLLNHRPKEKILLHICCAPCATAVREALESGYKIEFYFYNPNIQPKKEYLKRLQEAKKLAAKFGIKLREGKYSEASWKKDIAGYEKEAEGGKRCQACFRHRLKETALQAKKNNFSTFSTTLAVSPYKNFETISIIGRIIEQRFGLKFLSEDFKKNNGYH